MLRRLCKSYTQLSDSDIAQLERIESNLDMIANLVKADVFIDCSTSDPNEAIVVAEANPKPSICSSMYQQSVIGKLALRKNEPAVLRTLELGMSTRDLKAITQENKAVRQNVEPIKNKDGRVIAVLIMEQDITKDIKKNRQMEILSETTEQLTELLSFNGIEDAISNYINDAIIVFDKQGLATYANPAAKQLYQKLGYKDDIVGINFNNLTLDENQFDEIIAEQAPNMSEIIAGGLSLQIKYAIMKRQDKIAGLVILIKDITEVKKKEKELILKSVAIKEIHHRVKNNLQTIASLLRLQSRRIDNDLIKKAFNESINRILSIAITHDILAQKGVEKVDIKAILNKIKDSTIEYGVPNSKDIEIRIKGDSFIVDSDRATSIVLVVNELLQNSLKHAFKGRDSGLIEITVHKGSIYSNISIVDDGIGFEVTEVKEESLGFNIVKAIVKDKLFGNLNIEATGKGTKISFDFKN